MEIVLQKLKKLGGKLFVQWENFAPPWYTFSFSTADIETLAVVPSSAGISNRIATPIIADYPWNYGDRKITQNRARRTTSAALTNPLEAI